MLRSENLLEALLEHLKISDIVSTIPFQWNSVQDRFERNSCKKLQLYKLRLFIASTFLALVIFQVIWTWNISTTFDKLHTIFSLSGMLMPWITHLVFYFHSHEIIALLNRMLEFERESNCKFFSLLKPI